MDNSFFTNNVIILRDGDGPLFGIDSEGDNMIAKFIRLNRYAIIPLEQWVPQKETTLSKVKKLVKKVFK